MAECFAIIGLVAAIVQFIDHGSKVVNRLNEFRSRVEDAPKCYREIEIELPLLIATLRRTKEQAEAGNFSKDSQQELLTVVEGCLSQVELLNESLIKPTVGDSLWVRGIKAFSSVHREKKVQEITTKIRNYIQLLTYHQTTEPLKPQLKIKKADVIPFNRNPGFVGREEIFGEIDKELNQDGNIQGNAVLCGLGGVG